MTDLTKQMFNAPYKSSLAVNSSTDHVVRPSWNVQNSYRLGLLAVDGQDGEVLGHGKLDSVPLAVVVRLDK